MQRTGTRSDRPVLSRERRRMNDNREIRAMKSEIQCACDFLSGFLRKKSIPVQFVKPFRSRLEELLTDRFRNHWHPENPHRGSAYRCIRINGRLDPVVREAAKVTGLSDIGQYLPKEFTMWIDPSDVSYRFGEDGSICSCYNSHHTTSTSATAASTTTTTTSHSSGYSTYAGHHHHHYSSPGGKRQLTTLSKSPELPEAAKTTTTTRTPADCYSHGNKNGSTSSYLHALSSQNLEYAISVQV